MPAAIRITREDHTADQLRLAARRKDSAAARRMLALALVLEGRSRTEAAQAAGMDRQTLRDWVYRYNADGVAGLLDRPPPVRPGLLSAAQRAEFDRIVEVGPDVAVDGVGALAPGRSQAGDRAALRRGDGRAHGRGPSAGARLPARLGAAASPQLR